MENNIIKSFNLPSYIKDKSFAEASKAIQKKFEDREDMYAKQTMEELLGRLQQAQEFVKEQNKTPEQKQMEQMQIQQQQMQAQQGQDPMQQGQQEMPQMQEGLQQQLAQMQQGQPGIEQQGAQQQMAMGGFADSTFGKGLQEGATSEETSGSIGAGIGMATTALDFGQQVFGKANVDMSGNGGEEKISGGGAALSGVTKGAAAGQTLGPWGMAAGAVLGGVSGIIGAGKHNKTLAQAQTNKIHRGYNQAMNEYSTGGPLNSIDPNLFKIPAIPNFTGTSDDYHTDNSINIKMPSLATNPINGNPTTKNKKTNNTYYDYYKNKNNNDIDASVYGAAPYKGTIKPIEYNEEKDVNNPTGRSKVGKGLDWLGKNAGNIARYAPVGMNAYQLSKLKKPEVERLNKLDNRYKNQYVDERNLQNSVNEGFNQSSATEGSGGSLSRYSTISRANQLNKAKALSNAYMKAADINRNENKTGQQFNRSTDQFNISQDNAERDINARNRAAYDNQKSKFLSKIGTQVGQIGKEQVYNKQAKKLYGYNQNGELTNPQAVNEGAKKLDYTIEPNGMFKHKDGSILTAKEMAEKLAKNKQSIQTNENMFGGYLNKK